MKKTSDWLMSFNTNFETETHEILDHTQSLSPKKMTSICITGGKGGVGKTSISLKLAKELSAKGNRVLLIDCDYNLSNTAIKLGLPVNNTFFSLVSAEKSFEECLYKEGNFHLLSACNGSVELFNSSLKLEEVILDIMNEHESEYDFILLDCPAGLQRESLLLCAYSDLRIVVVTPDKASITDSYSLIKVLSQKHGIKENHLLVNKYSTRTQFSKVVKTMSETVENFLGCRTQILGGVKRLDVDHSRFDEAFLMRGKNDLHQNFLKVVEKLTEELSTSTFAASAYLPQEASMKLDHLNA